MESIRAVGIIIFDVSQHGLNFGRKSWPLVLDSFQWEYWMSRAAVMITSLINCPLARFLWKL